MKTTTAFKSQHKKKTWKTFHNTNCKTENAIYLMECTICNLQYAGKNETPLNIRLNNHREDILVAILVDKHYQKSGHRFNELARFAIIDRLTNINLDKEILRARLIQRENFWMHRLQTKGPKGLKSRA